MADLLDLLENLPVAASGGPSAVLYGTDPHVVDQKMELFLPSPSLLLKRSPSVRSVSFADKVLVKKLDSQMDQMDLRHGTTTAMDVKRELVSHPCSKVFLPLLGTPREFFNALAV